jgi:hypothetical protein
MALAIGAYTGLTSFLRTPDTVAINGLYILGSGGLFVIEGKVLLTLSGMGGQTQFTHRTDRGEGEDGRGEAIMRIRVLGAGPR